MFSIIVLVVVAAVVGLVAYEKSHRGRNHPVRADWARSGVVYGYIRWETTNFPASGIRVELRTRDIFFKSSLLHQFDRTGQDGYYEIAVVGEPSDCFLRVVYGGANGPVLLDDKDVALRVGEPGRVDMLVRTADEIQQTSLEPHTLEGTVYAVRAVPEPKRLLKKSDGSSVEPNGPIGQQLPTGLHLKVWGRLDTGAAQQRPFFWVNRYRIGAASDTQPIRGILLLRNDVWSVSSHAPGKLESGEFYIHDEYEEIVLPWPTSERRREIYLRERQHWIAVNGRWEPGRFLTVTSFTRLGRA